MGRSKIEITVTGDHGCDRAAQAGEDLGPLCDKPACVDCAARRLVAELAAAGNNVERAVHLHWPPEPYIVDDDVRQPKEPYIVDDHITGKRLNGHF